MGAVMASTYLAEDKDIGDAELYYTEWETDLLLQVNNAEVDYPDYDEYRYNVGDVGHNPYELMAYLTAAYQDFRYADVQAVLQQIFNEQYSLSFVPEVETRYNDPDDENGDGDLEEYEWHILHVNLTSRSFTGLVLTRISPEEMQIYNVLMQTYGNRQYVENVFDFNWLPYVSCYYGYRVHPTTGEKDYHKAVDIAVAQGTSILAGHDGVVTTATNHSSYGLYLEIEGTLPTGQTIVTKYAHCSQLLVSPGQQVCAGDVIAKVGSTGVSTGAHLHLEVIVDGQYLNPLYFAVTGDDGSGSLPPGSPGGPEIPAYPGAPMGDGSYAALLAEAQKHLGKPYVFGASGPDYFDCSGFVCWSLNQSGAASVGRITAQGLYNMSTPVSRENARPGDLIFFHSTYSTSNTVTHVGIYIGNGQMIHCGDPISYASIDTSYWQSHFYAFGRL
ncbi:peptidoglycan DD-metalloendopeptidase family protein [Ruminococcaceae bacterium OttesenSCG-928-A11]|nr:peptidoglycan DD-metalloendopeptidase family protein [Ruminococcaceae bacterium OttesenSCG-928-A11]